MSVSCPRCRHGWEPDYPGVGVASVPCPRCGTATPLRNLDGAGEDVRPGSAAAAEQRAEWMVRKSDGQVYGPFSRHTLVQWIKTGKILPDEEVSRIGGAWRLFAQHEEFGPQFAPGPRSPGSSGAERDLDFRRRKPLPLPIVQGARVAAAVAFAGVVGWGAWVAVGRGWFVVPDSVVSKAAKLAEAPADEEAPGASRVTTRVAELVAEIRKTRKPPADSSAVEAWLRGRALQREGTLDGLRAARTEFETAVAIDPDNALALAALGEVANRLAEVDPAARAAQRDSFYFIERALGTGEYGVECLRAKAWFLLATGHPKEAIGLAESARRKAPEDPEIALLLGTIRARSAGRLDAEAEKLFGEALERDPDLHEARLQLALAALAGGDEDRAERELRAVVKAHRKAARAWYHLGRILEDHGDLAAASEHFRKAVALQPGYGEAVMAEAGLAYRAEGRAPDAVSLYDRLLQEGDALSPSLRVDVLAHRAAALRAAGRLEDAVEGARAVLAERPGDPVAGFAAALAHAEAGRAGDATPLFARVEQEMEDLSRRDQGVLFLGQGEAFRRAGDFKAAVQAYSRAIERDPWQLPARILMAGSYARLGQRPDAVGAVLAGLKRDPMLWRRPARPGRLHLDRPSLGWAAEALEGLRRGDTFDPDLQAAIAAAWLFSGEPLRAREASAKALADDARHPQARLVAGLVSLESKDGRGALGHLDALLAGAHDSPVGWLYKGEAQLLAGDRSGAEYSVRKALSYDHDIPWAHARLGELLVGRGDRAEARSELEAARQRVPELLDPARQLARL